MSDQERSSTIAMLQKNTKDSQLKIFEMQNALKRLKIEERVEKKTVREQPKGNATRALTDEQYEEIITTMRQGFSGARPNDRIATALVLEANTGMKISDILNLKMSDIVQDGNRWRLDIVNQSNGKERSFIVAQQVYVYIENYCLRNGIGPSERIFPIKARSVQRQLEKVCVWLGYDHISTHSFRKYFATRIYQQNGNDLLLVQAVLQHASPATTLKYIGAGIPDVEEYIFDTDCPSAFNPVKDFSMGPSKIIYALLDKTRCSQMQLAKQLGYSTQSAVQNRLRQKTMGVDIFQRMMDAFGYEIVVRPRDSTDPADEMKVY